MNVAISGGTGFIGRHLIEELAEDRNYRLSALRRRDGIEASGAVSWVRGGIEDVDALRQIMVPGGVFVHLAHPSDWSLDRHLDAAKRLADTAIEAGLRRFVHCSTAIVAGNPGTHRITESTLCQPVTSYERTKLEIEQVLTATLANTVELVILRPTAVFGPNGLNLVKLARALTSGSRVSNYLRSSLFGRRTMNLVCVENVTAAIRFAIDLPPRLVNTTYLISDDDDPANNFRDVESSLMRLLGVAPYGVSPLPVPAAALGVALKAAGRQSAAPYRIYDSSRLVQAGFKKRVTLAQGLERFARWFNGE